MKADDTDAMEFIKSLRESDVLRTKTERERLEFEREKLSIEAD